MDAFSGEGVQVGRHGRGQGLALTGLHLGNTSLMEYDAAEHLHAELALARHAVGCLANDGVCFRQQVIQRFAIFDALAEFHGLAAELFVAQCLMCFFKRVDFIDDFIQAFDLPDRRVE